MDAVRPGALLRVREGESISVVLPVSGHNPSFVSNLRLHIDEAVDRLETVERIISPASFDGDARVSGHRADLRRIIRQLGQLRAEMGR